MKKYLKRSLQIFLTCLFAMAAAFMMPGSLHEAKAEKIGNIEYSLDSSGTLTITGFGEMPFGANVLSKVNSQSVRKIVIGDGITSVGESVFRSFSNVTEVTLGKDVKTIEYCAFENCSALSKVTLNEGLCEIREYAFAGCQNLREITIPKTVESISYYAFNTYFSGEYQADEDGGKELAVYKPYDSIFTMRGYINTGADEYASRGYYRVKFIPLGGDLSKCTVKLSINEFYYDGKAKKPEVTVVTASYYTLGSEYYRVSYKNNKKIGIATAIATAKAPLTGSCEANFKIIKKWDTSELVQYALYEIMNQGYDTDEIKYMYEEGGMEAAYDIAEELLYRLMEIDYRYMDLTVEDLINAICGDGSSSDHTHSYGKYVSNKDATVFKDGTKTATCSCGEKKTVTDPASRLKATIKVPSKKFDMQIGQVYKSFKVTMAKGDSIVSVKSANKELVKISSINKTKGTFTLTAGNATGKNVKVKITLKSGRSAILDITVQKKAIKTTQITGLKKEITLKKGAKATLRPVLAPITSKQKITYQSSDPSVASVSSSGVVTAKKRGTAKITVRSGSKKTIVAVTVK